MKVPDNMILVGSLVTHSKSGRKGIVLKIDGALRHVCFPDIDESCWVNVRDLEWTDATPTKKYLALDKILISLECTAMWLEGGCNPLHAAEELRLNIAAVKKLREAEVVT